MGILAYSEKLFETAKASGRQHDREQNRVLLSSSSMEEAIKELNTDQKKLAAWINIYNALSYLSLTERPELLKNKASRGKHFRDRKFLLLDEMFSLDIIEHGVLRRKSHKYSLGYFQSPFYPSFIKKLMVNKVDPRIHFALNCGAASCPIIRYYDWQIIDQQLDEAVRSYVSQYFDKDEEKNEITISKIFFWFKGDFGGKSGIINFLKRHGFLEKNDFPKIKYHHYDWRINLQDLSEKAAG